MSSHRSPNCPQITFADAITKARRVYDKEHTHAAPKAAVAEDLGYSGINGRALSVIGALRQYGILEGNSEGLRITEDAVTYFELEDGLEKNEAIFRMVFTPSLFENLRQQFGDALPSESTLKFHLIKLGFLPKAADEVISVYRANMELIKESPRRSDADVSTAEGTSMLATTPASYPIYPTSQPTVVMMPASALSFSFPLSMDTKAELHIRGVVTESELEMLRDQIELTIKALKRSQTPSRTNELPSQNEDG
jgi:hypothetical protein